MGEGMSVEEMIKFALAHYIGVAMFCSGWIFEPLRNGYRKIREVFTLYEVEECRMCMGGQLTLVLIIAYHMMGEPRDLELIASYGISYFLATQER